MVDVWGAGRVGIRLSPATTQPGETPLDSTVMDTYGAYVDALSEIGLLYVHDIEGVTQQTRDADEVDFHALRKRFGGAYIANNIYDLDLAEETLAAGRCGPLQLRASLPRQPRSGRTFPDRRAAGGRTQALLVRRGIGGLFGLADDARSRRTDADEGAPGVNAADVFTKLDVELKPDPSRTVIRPFGFGYPAAFERKPTRAQDVARRVMDLDTASRDRMLQLLQAAMEERHRKRRWRVRAAVRGGEGRPWHHSRGGARPATARRLFQPGICLRIRSALQSQHRDVARRGPERRQHPLPAIAARGR